MPTTNKIKTHGSLHSYRIHKCRRKPCNLAKDAFNQWRRNKRYDRLEQFKNKPCNVCGKVFPFEAMDFNHLDTTTKFTEVGALAEGPLDRLEAEIAKCELLCSNCHRVKTKNNKQLTGKPRRIFKTAPGHIKHGSTASYGRHKCRCNLCFAAFSAAHAKHRGARKVIVDALKDASCKDCNLNFPPECMEFGHRKGTVKIGNVAQMHMTSLKKLLEEIAKCDLVCSNCHRVRTFRKNFQQSQFD